MASVPEAWIFLRFWFWQLVEEMEGVNEKDHVIHLRLDEIMKKNRNMKVFCPPAEVDKVMSIIESKIQK